MSIDIARTVRAFVRLWSLENEKFAFDFDFDSKNYIFKPEVTRFRYEVTSVWEVTHTKGAALPTWLLFRKKNVISKPEATFLWSEITCDRKMYLPARKSRVSGRKVTFMMRKRTFCARFVCTKRPFPHLVKYDRRAMKLFLNRVTTALVIGSCCKCTLVRERLIALVSQITIFEHNDNFEPLFCTLLLCTSYRPHWISSRTL